ncbi:MAG TPA: glycosyltransferase family 4 protein [Ktedonobacteraceae bacterium]|nr:glycosyltransferase family 4 protein [Ktedonobacteraceae bacterium]
MNMQTGHSGAARILMVAPQPFFAPRGAAFCVYQYINALVTLGYGVDLVTYSIGEDVALPGLTIYRTPALPFVRAVKPGFSLAKFPLDLLLFLTALWRLCRGRYRYLHTHEEAALIGALLAPLFRCRHLYYMHCDLSQLVGENPLVVSCVRAAQALMIRCADAIVAFYPECAGKAKKIAPRKSVYVILPAPVDAALSPPSQVDVEKLRQQWAPNGSPIILYTGTLEKYQGIDLLLRSAALVTEVLPAARYVIVGGTPEQVERFRELARQIGVEKHVHFVGQRPLQEMPCYMALADVLVSPRTGGTHTPLKLYTYLRSGRPVLATDILSHTQVLSPAIAMLAPPTPQGLAQGTLSLLRDAIRAEELGKRGQHFANEHYSWDVFLEKNRQLSEEFMNTGGSCQAFFNDFDE